MPTAAAQAWTRDTIRPADWTVPLPPAALAELRAVLAELRRAPLPTFLLDPADSRSTPAAPPWRRCAA
jgi:hypothetical protein